MSQEDAPIIRHLCGSWLTSSGDSQQWYCAECGRSANDISWILPVEVIDDPRGCANEKV